ncbi:uncharacterized protein LOC135847730 isoform X6 [Planococcus citri]|uniref:uncharacterized protein LOC135847730 isoform X6 n=1 Tax=Planococcus citri TaxID=170843 RepID=UPI0031F8BE4B
MAERTSNVYDILHPSPVSLKELSVIAVGLEVWRCEINEYRKNGTLDSFRTTCSDITSLLRTKLPELPSVIYDVIVEYVTRLGKSIPDWLEAHSRTVCYFEKRFPFRLSEVLEYFDDFVGDYDGTIDFVKTSERMMHCDGFDDVLKFIVACKYFLEDHVRRIWPSVRQKMNLSSIDFFTNPQLYYWICCLSGQLNKISIDPYDTVNKKMLIECIHQSGNSLAIHYFWNRIPYGNQMRMAISVYGRSVECFVRCILPKLDDQQLEELVNEKGSGLMRALLQDLSCDERLIFQAWMYINNTMDGSNFSKLVVSMLRIEAGYFIHSHQTPENWLRRCCLIWNNAPHNLKRSAITKISTKKLIICQDDFMSSPRRTSSEFLLSILSDFTLEEKQSFWRNCWKNLMLNKNVRDLQRIMEVCFEQEDDMIKFMDDVMAASENLQLRCISLLSRANFNELNALVNFCCSRIAETVKLLKRHILMSSLISDDFHLDFELVVHCEEFNTFINNAYDSVDQATDFKHQLVSSPRILEDMSICVEMPEVSYEALRKFIEAFVSTEQVLQLVKSSIIDGLKGDAIRRNYRIIEEAQSKPLLDQFLLWCLGSNEQVMEFMQTCITPCHVD